MLKIGNIELPEFPLLLAPMEDVSDPPFRALCKEQGADVVYTEFISSEGLIRNAAKSTKKLDIYTKERPVGIIIFVLTMSTEPKEAENDTPVNDTVSSARLPHSPSFHAFAPQPGASNASLFQ